jgi:hypothetical protein
VLDAGEPGFDTDEPLLRVGDGSTPGGVAFLPAGRTLELLPAVTTLTGGGPTALDAVEARDGGYYAVDLAAEGFQVWRFREGDEATDAEAGLVRHADWTEGEFEFVFERRLPVAD